MAKYVIATKEKSKIKEIGKPIADIKKLFFKRGEEGQAILMKNDDGSYVPKYKWVESGLLWRPIKK